MEQLKVEGISKSFDGEPVLADISITLNKGELVSLLGISGGGKTTLFNIIAGLSRPDTGHVLLDGEDVTGCPGRVSYMLQKDLLLPYRTIEDNVALPLIVKGMKKREAREANEISGRLAFESHKCHVRFVGMNKQQTCTELHQHGTYTTGHATDTCNTCNSGFREHITYSREDVL